MFIHPWICTILSNDQRRRERGRGGEWGVSPLCFLITAFSHFRRKYDENFLRFREKIRLKFSDFGRKFV
jgi:hypothetical protein